MAKSHGVQFAQRRERNHQIETVGKQLRKMMSWISSKEV